MPRRRSFPARLLAYLAAGLLVTILFIIGLLHFRQHSLIYHPRPYDQSYARALPANGVEIAYDMPFGRQTAYFIPGREHSPKYLWIAFCGNGSLALDWTTILRGYPENGDAFLLIDYPGYGKNGGYATIATTRASAEAAVVTVAGWLQQPKNELHLCAIGHSLGAAAAIDFSAHEKVERLVAISPFTTLREEAATVVGPALARLLIENYDNRENLRRILQTQPGVQIAILHGTDDQVIPFRLGQKLAAEFPAVTFYAIKGADHVSVLEEGRQQIIDWMAR